MALDLRDAGVGGLLPFDGARLLVKTIDAPLVLRVVLDGSDIAVQPHAEVRILLPADGRRQTGEIAPDDRAGQPETGQRCLPRDGLALGDVPGDWRRLAFGDAGGSNPAKLWPVNAGPRRDGGGHCEVHRCKASRRCGQSSGEAGEPRFQVHATSNYRMQRACYPNSFTGA